MKSCLKFLRLVLYTLLSFFYFPKNISKSLSIKNKNILYLTPFRRETKLDEVLKENGFGIILLNHDYQKKISGIFFGNLNLKYYDYIQIINQQKIKIFLYRIFINNLIKFLKKKNNLKKVINFAVHYKSEFQYDFICTKNNLDFITLHRECLYASKNSKSAILKNLKLVPKYCGTKIIVHNDIVKNIFLQSSFCDDDQITQIGPLRIDDNINIETKKINGNKTVLFYIFGTGAMIQKGKTYGSDWGIDYGWFKLLENTYNLILDIAERYPKTNFIFKAKYDSASYRSYHDDKLKNRKLNNIYYAVEEKDYELLKKTDLVISFNSTTIVEAILFKKSLLIPFYDEASNDDYLDFVGFEELRDSVSGCKKEEILKNKLSEFIEKDRKYHISQQERIEILEKYIGQLDGLNFSRLKKILI